MINSCNNSNYKPAFKGWDASRPLKALHFLAPSNVGHEFVGLMQEMKKIGKKENFDVVCQTQKGFFRDMPALVLYPHSTAYSWLQDEAMQLPGNRLFYQCSFKHFCC